MWSTAAHTENVFALRPAVVVRVLLLAVGCALVAMHQLGPVSHSHAATLAPHHHAMAALTVAPSPDTEHRIVSASHGDGSSCKAAQHSCVAVLSTPVALPANVGVSGSPPRAADVSHPRHSAARGADPPDLLHLSVSRT